MDQRNGLFVDDSVIFKVEICVVGELENKILSANIEIALPNLEACLKKMLENGNNSDITLKVAESNIRAHGCILSARSPVFAAMLSSKMFECHSGIVQIDDVDPIIVKELLHYIYTNDLSDITVLDNLCEHLFCAASKYQVLGLVALCEDHICSKISLENVIHTISLGDSYGSTRIKERAFQFIAQNHELILKKDLLDLDKSLTDEIQFAIEMAMRRQGCLGSAECEKRFNGSCNIM